MKDERSVRSKVLTHNTIHEKMGNMDNDILCEIADSDLLELANIYKNHQNWIPYAYSFIITAIKWKKSEKHRHQMTIWSPHNTWRKDGTVIVLNEFYCHNLVVFTLEDSCQTLYNGLSKTQRLNYQHNIEFFCLHSKFEPTIYRIAKEKNLEFNINLPCVMVSLTPEEAKQLKINCPPEVYLKPLHPSHAVQINYVWPHKYENSDKKIATLIEMNGGIGVFLKSSDKLVAWAVVHILGNLGLVQSEEAYRRKGYGALVTRALSVKLANDGFYPFGTVVHTNTASLAMFIHKLGFKDIGRGTYCGRRN